MELAGDLLDWTKIAALVVGGLLSMVLAVSLRPRPRIAVIAGALLIYGLLAPIWLGEITAQGLLGKAALTFAVAAITGIYLVRNAKNVGKNSSRGTPT